MLATKTPPAFARLRSGTNILLPALLALLLVPGSSWAQGLREFAESRKRMVEEEIVGAGIKNARVIEALREVPRHDFVPRTERKYAYFDMALPIGYKQTISPPFVVAYMTEQLDPQPNDKVLEVGTGSGYQAAVLSRLVRQVYTVEIVEPLGRKAAEALRKLKYDNVYSKVGDGYQGWAKYAPFDKIIVTCSPERVPAPLVDQLKEGGRMVIPVGERYQQTLYLLKKEKGKLVAEKLQPTLFVPMLGAAESIRQVQPDPRHPAIVNGDFEDLEGKGKDAKPVGWHYQRQLTSVSDDAPSGKNYVQFKNVDPGRGSQALQGFAVDGRQVKELEVAFMVRGTDIRPGHLYGELPKVAITFFDENRGYLSEEVVGGWRGTFKWQPEHVNISVPTRAREAILRIGLEGGLGELSLDAIRISAAEKRK